MTLTLPHRGLRLAVCAVLALVLGGGGLFTSETRLEPLAEWPASVRQPEAGVYCALAAPERIDRDSCLAIAPEDGALRATRLVGGRPADAGVRLSVVSPLTRGAALLHAQPLDNGAPLGDGHYRTAILREDGMVFLVGAPIIARERAAAETLGVTLVSAPGYDFGLEGGAPADIVAWLTDVIDAQFDRALRDPVLSGALMAPENFYVRVADEPGEIVLLPSAPEPAAVDAIDRLRTAARFAMTLE